MRSNENKPERWNLKDTASGLWIMTNKHIDWARSVRDAINNVGKPPHRAKDFAQEWLTHLDETKQLEKEGNDEPISQS